MLRQHLAERAPRRQALAVVSDIAGLHAQVAASAELTLWARVEGLKRGQVDDLLWKRKKLVKTWAMRGTLHLLPSAELPRYVGALSRLKPRHHVPSWLRYHGLEREQADEMLAAIAKALDGAELTREELAQTVAKRVGEPELADRLKGGFGDLLKPAAFTGDLCFAPSDGQRVRFTHPRTWLPGWEDADPEAATDELVRTYLRAYGPAPREQFQRWFGMTSPAEAGRWIEALGDEVEEVDVEGGKGWMLAEDVDNAANTEPTGTVRLLPGFDHYVVAAPRKAEAVLETQHRDRVYRPQGWLSPTLVVDGRIEGVWSLEGNTLLIEPFKRATKHVKAGIENEVEKLASFYDLTLDLSLRT
jgi:uncharacterized protein YcaQ